MALLDDRSREPEDVDALRTWHEQYQAIMNSPMSAIEALRALKALGSMPNPDAKPSDGEG